MRTTAVQVAELTDAAEARRVAAAMAARLGFTPEQEGRVALVATEAATNLVRHGGGGEVLVNAAERGGRTGVEIIALDKGGGMQDVGRSMRDGYSTAGSSGTGLGAISRLSSEYEIYSVPGKGTALLAHIFAGTGPLPPEEAGGLEIAGVAVPVRGEQVCGDAWSARFDARGAVILVADGLGHGPMASEASRQAVEIFEEVHGDLKSLELMHRIHGALRATRGASVALARVRTGPRMVCFTGVGNISGAVVAEGSTKQMVSHPGTVGLEMRRVHEFKYAYPEGALVVIHSDGIASHWSLDPYPGIRARSATLIAAVLYRDFKRGRDDAAVVVAKARREA